MVGFVSSPRLVEHDTGPHHPERPDRLRAVYRGLSEAGLLLGADPFPEFALKIGLTGEIGRAHVDAVEPQAVGEDLLLLAHTPEHVRRVKHVCAMGGGVLDQGDTPVGANGHEMAMLSLACTIGACEAVMSGRVGRAFAAGRPPGHHAEPDRAMGFCIYSNVAIAARYIQREFGVGRVAIVDFDVHHGNGTQAVLEGDPTVFFVSLHQHPRTCYPGTGHDWEIGTGKGRGYTLNIPLDPGTTDAEYLRILDSRVVPELDEFAPEILLLSAGFDAHAEDPLAQMAISDEGFGLITRTLTAVADRHCGGRVISTLEGGYNLKALGRSLVRHILALQG